MTKSLSNSGVPIGDTVRRIQDEIAGECARVGRSASDVRLMAVTKTVAPEHVNEAIAAGITLLGENKAQELCAKFDSYNLRGVDTHFIGHLQTNKVRQIIDKVSMIESLDSMDLAKEISRQSEKHGKIMDCLVEVNIGKESSKSGILPEEVPDFLSEVASLGHIRVCGFMSIPPDVDDNKKKECFFDSLHKLFVDSRAKKIDNINSNDLEYLSMGMSGDYLLAIKHGSNIVRIGTLIFGGRDYAAD